MIIYQIENTSNINGNSEEEYIIILKRNNEKDENKYKIIHIKSKDKNIDKGKYNRYVDRRIGKISKI